MSESSPSTDRVVWFDLPVSDLERASTFYRAVLAIDVQTQSHEGESFAVLEHGPGNGGCLIVRPDEGASDRGPLLYLNVEGRIRAAEAAAVEHGGALVEGVHAIGPHGFRAIVRDSEGNRVALHSSTDG